MNSLNRSELIGNLTRDPELKKLDSGQSVCTFSMATNRQYTDKSGTKHDEPEYHNIVAWGRLAEICAQYLQKGKKVFIAGRIRTREWEGQDGQKRYRTEITAEDMIMLGEKRNGAPPERHHADTTPMPEDEVKLEDIPY